MLRRIGIFLLISLAPGCSAKLETGYEPVKLGTLTPVERRGLYAPSYSIEARAAEEENKNSGDEYRTPLPGGQR